MSSSVGDSDCASSTMTIGSSAARQLGIERREVRGGAGARREQHGPAVRAQRVGQRGEEVRLPHPVDAGELKPPIVQQGLAGGFCFVSAPDQHPVLHRPPRSTSVAVLFGLSHSYCQ